MKSSNDKLEKKTMQHFERCQLPKYDNLLSRDSVSRQVLKICFGCKKGFCQRKGRAKAAPVSNNPGRFVCKKCADKLISGVAVEGVSAIPGGYQISNG